MLPYGSSAGSSAGSRAGPPAGSRVASASNVSEVTDGGRGRYSMVWVSTAAKIDALMAMSEAHCCAAFQAHFGDRAGRFLSLDARKFFPLKLRTITPRAVGRIAVIGNAAQALHPVAGQGFNLGLRDAQALSRCFGNVCPGAASSIVPHEPLSLVGVMSALRNYDQARGDDVERSVGFTDFLVSAFVGNGLGLRAARGLGMLALDVLPTARRTLARRMLYGAAR